MELSGHKKTPVPNRGFVPGHPRSYNLFGPETTNIHYFLKIAWQLNEFRKKVKRSIEVN